MKGHILMSVKEVDRIPVIQKLVKGEIKVTKAANILSLSNRQILRLGKRYREKGISGLIHQSRGKVSFRKISESEVERVAKIIKDSYSDFGPTLALEKLRENHGVTFSRETLRKAMMEKGLWKAKKRRYLVVHQRRKRRTREGELIQTDGSPHFWFEDRGEYCTLLVFVDDATGKLKYLQFVKTETTDNYFRAVFNYISKYGKPIAFYVDKHGVFRVNAKRGGMASSEDSVGLTQFARAMRELNISLIFANSPEAKGRVEKANATLQDRLVKEMRLRGISTLEEGNKFLAEFMGIFNQKFAVKPESSEDAHRPLLLSENLKGILVKKETRRLSKNLEFQYKSKIYQLKTERPSYSLRYAPVIITEDWNGVTRVYYKGKRLRCVVVEKLPFLKVANEKEIYQEVEKIVKRSWKPAKDHPWRQYTYANL